MSKIERKIIADHIEVEVSLKVTWRNGTQGSLLHSFGGKASKNVEYTTLRMFPEPTALGLVSQALTQQVVLAIGQHIQPTLEASEKIVADAQSGFVNVHTDESETSQPAPKPAPLIILGR